MSIPLPRLPSLDALRGFVAVGRRMSITEAARDLYLTQSAVSRQVQTLETALGCKLLIRSHRAIRFTPEGERLFVVADAALTQIQSVAAALAGGERRPVTITASMGVTALWLLPRLGQFQQQHPDIDVRVAANNRILDLRAEGIDIAIRYCAASKAPAGAVRLFDDTVAVVASPVLGVQGLSAQAVAANVLLEYDNPGHPWLHWSERLAAAGLEGVKPKAILRFNQYDQVIQAATTGQGLALGRRPLVDAMLADGRLRVVEAGEGGKASGYSHWLVEAGEEGREEVRAVSEWLQECARDQAAATRGERA